MPEKQISAKRPFSLRSRAKSVAYAWRGLFVFVQSTHNSWVEIAVAIFVILLGIYFRLSEAEWLAVIIMIGFVLAAEAINTAFEIDIDLTSPQYHPHARDVKDIAAAAVLISSIIALIVGLIIFLPHIFRAFS